VASRRPRRETLWQDDKKAKSRATGPGFARIARDPFEEGGWMVRPSSYQL